MDDHKYCIWSVHISTILMHVYIKHSIIFQDERCEVPLVLKHHAMKVYKGYGAKEIFIPHILEVSFSSWFTPMKQNPW